MEQLTLAIQAALRNKPHRALQQEKDTGSMAQGLQALQWAYDCAYDGPFLGP